MGYNDIGILVSREAYMEILIINTGGTFNKIYDPIKGELIVPHSNIAIEQILKRLPAFYNRVAIKGIIYKDSLDMDDRDRKTLFKTIIEAKTDYIIVVHGTDTMDISAKYIAEQVKNKTIVFTGAMVPFSIDKVEATANLSSALIALDFIDKGVYISMQGYLLPYNKIYKDKTKGIFKRLTNGSNSIFNP